MYISTYRQNRPVTSLLTLGQGLLDVNGTTSMGTVC